MTWVPVESTDVAAIGYEGEGPTNEPGVDDLGLGLGGAEALGLSDVGNMGVMFHKPPGSTYLYYGVPRSLYEEFLEAPSKGKFANFVLKRAGLAYDKIA